MNNTLRPMYRLMKFLTIAVLGIEPAFSAMSIQTLSLGDGYHHDELGSSYDFFDSTSSSLSAYYTFYGTSDTVQFNTGYSQFSLSSVPPSTSLASAYLNVYLEARFYTDESPSAGFIRHVANSSGAIGSASQRLNGTELVVEIKDQAIGWLQLDVTSYVQNDLDNGYSHSAFSFNPNTAGYFRNAGFQITTAEAASNGMYLTLNAVPEPSLGVLMLGGLIWFRRRR